MPASPASSTRRVRAKDARKRRDAWIGYGVQLALACMVLVGLATFGAGVRHIVLHLQSLVWTPTDAVMLSLEEVVSEAPRKRPTWRLEGSYRYEFGGQRYVGERISFSIVSAAGADDWDDRVRARLRGPGAPITVWVDPDDPARSVAVRDIRWIEVGAALLFGLMFSGGGAVLLRALRSKGGPPPRTDEPIGVSWRAVTLMWLIAPCGLVLAWLLWRDDMPILAGCATLPLLLALNGTWRGLRGNSQTRGAG